VQSLPTTEGWLRVARPSMLDSKDSVSMQATKAGTQMQAVDACWNCTLHTNRGPQGAGCAYCKD
jgi:hypothetical protein